MGIYNTAVNRLLERKTVFADLINGGLYDGRQVIRPEDLEPVSDNSGILYQNEKGEKKALERRGDIRMRANKKTYSVIFAEETQQNVHYGMVVRNMLYDTLEYTKQLQDREKLHKEQGEKLSGSEFLSGITKEDRFSPVVNIVLFFGDSWDGAESLHDLIHWGSEEEKAFWKSFVPDYHLNLIHACSVEEPKKFRSCLQQIFSVLKYRQDKKNMRRYLLEHQDELDRMDRVEQEAMTTLLGMREQLFPMIEEENIMMCQAFQELFEDARMEGRVAGRSEGRTEGHNAGLAEGARKKQIELICKKLRKGKSPELIAEDLEEDLETIQEICKAAESCAPEYDCDAVYEACEK